MASVELSLRGYAEVKRLLDKLAKFGIDNTPLFFEIGFFLQSQIKYRTSIGFDADGDDFKPYSTRYAAYRKSKGLPIDIVDLFFTGSMLSSMSFTAEQDKVRLFFQSTTDKFGGYNPLKAYFINEDQGREFFAMSSEDMDSVINSTTQALEMLIEKVEKANA